MGRFEQIKANLRRAYDARRASARAEAAEEVEAPPAEPPPPPQDAKRVNGNNGNGDDLVPHALRVGAAWAWRLIVIGVVLFFAIQLLARLTVMVVPLAVALLLTALLGAAVGWLRGMGLPRTLATTIVVIGGLAALVGTLTLVVSAFIDGLPSLTSNAQQGLDEIEQWLKEGPLHLTAQQLDNVSSQLQKLLNDNTDSLTTGAIQTASTAVEVVGGTFLMLFALFFFLRDGRMIWRACLSVVPRNAREPLDEAGIASWRSLVSYVRATVLVAFIDAVGIGVGLWILKVPLALPLAALVFLTSFIPIIGATLSGTVAVLVALVTNGPITALLALAVVLGVQQIEGHLLQPLIMGRALALHPLAVLVAVSAGLVLSGVVGALIAVPIIAVLNTGIRHLAARNAQRPPPEKPGVVKPAGAQS